MAVPSNHTSSTDGAMKFQSFSYLKELLLPQASVLVDGLPFTTEGYATAKTTILKTKYGKISEVIKVV